MVTESTQDKSVSVLSVFLTVLRYIRKNWLFVVLYVLVFSVLFALSDYLDSSFSKTAPLWPLIAIELATFLLWLMADAVLIQKYAYANDGYLMPLFWISSFKKLLQIIKCFVLISLQVLLCMVVVAALLLILIKTGAFVFDEKTITGSISLVQIAALLLFADLFFAYFMARYLVAIPEIVINGVGAVQAMGHSAKSTKAYVWRVLPYLFFMLAFSSLPLCYSFFDEAGKLNFEVLFWKQLAIGIFSMFSNSVSTFFSTEFFLQQSQPKPDKNPTVEGV